MHRVINSFVKSFSEDHQLDDYSLDKQFEFFCNHCIVQSKALARFDVESLTIQSADNGIDGLAIIIDGEVIYSVDDFKLLLASNGRKFEVEIVFIQAKSGENFNIKEFSRFCTGAVRFASELDYLFQSPTLSDQQELFKCVLDNAPRIMGSIPKFSSFFVTTGRYTKSCEWEDEKHSLITNLSRTGYCRDPEVFVWGHEELTKCWNEINSDYAAKLPSFSAAPLPEMPAVNEAYLALVKAKDLVDQLLLNSDGTMRVQVFEENVRSFLGVENPINEKIAETIKSDYQMRFPVLNNGVTIVSPDVEFVGNNFHVKKYQIVNGCQTCNVLYQNRSDLDDLMVTVKIVETKDEDVFVQLVNATNSQTKIDNAQFNSLNPVARRVEHYFKAMGDDSASALYFERRDKQFVGAGIPSLRIYSLKDASRCVAAMFLERPELASRFPLRMFSELSDKLYDENLHEIVFYAACMAMHRFNLLRSNRMIPQNFQRFKWHFLPLIRLQICGSDTYLLSDKKIISQCEKIIKTCQTHNPVASDVFDRVVTTMHEFENTTLDQLKALSTFQKMQEAHKRNMAKD